MDHADHVRLLRDGVPARNGIPASDERVVWADLGAGEGAFTLALADLLPPDSVIHAIDKDRGALTGLERAYARLAKGRELPRVRTAVGDFTRDLALGPLDGIVMANSLHFVKDKPPVLALARSMLRPGGRLLLVEYDTDRGNTWVPHPLSFEAWGRLASASGFGAPQLLATQPSRFLGRIYSASTMPTAR